MVEGTAGTIPGALCCDTAPGKACPPCPGSVKVVIPCWKQQGLSCEAKETSAMQIEGRKVLQGKKLLIATAANRDGDPAQQYLRPPQHSLNLVKPRIHPSLQCLRQVYAVLRCSMS